MCDNGQVPLCSPRTPVSMQLGTFAIPRSQSPSRSQSRTQKRTQSRTQKGTQSRAQNRTQSRTDAATPRALSRQCCEPLPPHTHVRTALTVHGGRMSSPHPPTRKPLSARSLWASLLVVQILAPRQRKPTRQRSPHQRSPLRRRPHLAANPPAPRVRARTQT